MSEEALHRYQITLAYDGTDYSGWQMQRNATSIQQIIEKALSTVLRDNIRITGAGRTDAGVHALEQCAHFSHSSPDITERSLLAFNSLLPHDIRILTLRRASPRFHAQQSAEGKIYHYHLWLDRILSPFVRRYRSHLHHPIDLHILKEGMAFFIGTHDFTSFANAPNEGAVAKNPIRTIWRIEAIEQEGGIRIEFEGNGFLYKMIRNITGTLIEAAGGKRPLNDIPRILEVATDG